MLRFQLPSVPGFPIPPLRGSWTSRSAFLLGPCYDKVSTTRSIGVFAFNQGIKRARLLAAPFFYF
jgi:hypothetical protein